MAHANIFHSPFPQGAGVRLVMNGAGRSRPSEDGVSGLLGGLGRAENHGVSPTVIKRGDKRDRQCGAGFTLSPVPVSEGAFGVRWGDQAVGQVL